MMRYWAPGMVNHGRDGTSPVAEVGAEMQRFITAFPDIHVEIEEIVAGRDLVSTRLTVKDFAVIQDVSAPEFVDHFAPPWDPRGGTASRTGSAKRRTR